MTDREDEDNDSPEFNDEDFGEARDAYETLAEWMEDKQGNDGDWSAEQIEEVLQEHEAINEDGTINMDGMAQALADLGLDYAGYDAETWDAILAGYGLQEG